MNGWLGLSLELQMAAVAAVGLMLGPCINWAIYNGAYFPRPISPWRRHRFMVFVEKEPELKKVLESPLTLGIQHLPIFGWIFLRHESPIHGRLFWLRPFLIEVTLPIFLAWLFWFEVTGGLLPPLALPPLPNIQSSLHVQFFAHSILCLFMCIATFIDFDERTIPDSVTIPGTLIGLVGAVCFSDWHLWISLADPINNVWPSTLHYDSPWYWSKFNGLNGLLIGLGCFAVWCFSLADRRLILRRGWRKTIQYFLAGLVRIPTWKILAGIWIIGSFCLAVAWSWLNAAGQQALLSSLMGMLIGGLNVWLVRWIAGMAIGTEALGFGDVTLMAMVGAYVGWQPAVIAFFISPMIALLFVVIRYFLTGDNQTPFGPYLCAGVLVTILCWDKVWNGYFQPMLDVMGPFIGQLLLVALLLLGGLLWVWRLIKQLVFARQT